MCRFCPLGARHRAPRSATLSQIVNCNSVPRLPMFWMGRDNGVHLTDMPMESSMWQGMVLIAAGIGVACYGLLPRKALADGAQHRVVVTAPEGAPSAARIGN